MEDHDLMYYRMFKAVIAASQGLTNGPIVATRPGYVRGLNKLIIVVGKIEVADGISGTDTTGSTSDRKTLYGELALQYLTITNAGAGYGADIDSDTIFNKFNKTVTEVMTFGFDSIAAKCDQLTLDCIPYETELETDWGIDLAHRTAFANKLVEYRAEYNNPRQAIVVRSTQNQEIIPALVVEGMKILKRTMDKGANTLKVTQPVWYGNYTHSRELITVSHEITTVTILVKNNVTHLGIPYPHASSPEHHLSKEGDLIGSTIMDHFTPGDSTILVEATGFHSKTIPVFHIKPGQHLHFDIDLDPIV